MLTVTFAGHREIFDSQLNAKIINMLDEIFKRDKSFVFFVGNNGDFDAICASAVRAAKIRYPELSISLVLVLPYMSNTINNNKEYYEDYFDDIIIPIESQLAHYKAAITERNKWMINRANILISYITRDYGGAYNSIKYAKKQNIEIYNLI